MKNRKASRQILAALLAALMALALLSSCSGGKGSGKESGSEALGNDGTSPEATEPEATEPEATEPEATETDPEEENVKTKRVIVISGQSNAVGHSAQKYLPDRAGKISAERVNEMKKGYENIKIYYSNNPFQTYPTANTGFAPVTFGCGVKNSSAVTFGPEVGLAEYLNKTYPGEEFYIVKAASGATALFETWNPNYKEKDSLYAQMLTFVEDALGKLKEEGTKTEIIAFCWMQGESDVSRGGDFYKSDPGYQKYKDLFGQLVDGFAEKFRDYLPKNGLAVIEPGISTYWNGGNRMNSAKEEFAAERENTYYFSTSDLTWNLDNTDYAHFDAAGMVTLGNRFGERISTILGGS